jgi:hypothetical protein
MPAERYQLKGLRIGALPILNGFIARMGLEEELTFSAAERRPRRCDTRTHEEHPSRPQRTSHAIEEWVGLFDVALVARGKINDDKLARALDRLFVADRATLQTRIVLAVMKNFDLKMDQIHNDTTS